MATKTAGKKTGKNKRRARKVWHIYRWTQRFELRQDAKCRTGPLVFTKEFVGSGVDNESIAYKQQMQMLGAYDNPLQLRGAFSVLKEIAANRSRAYRGYILDERFEPATEMKIAMMLGMPRDGDVKGILKALAEVGLIERIDCPEFDPGADRPDDRNGEDEEKDNANKEQAEKPKSPAKKTKRTKKKSKKTQKNKKQEKPLQKRDRDIENKNGPDGVKKASGEGRSGTIPAQSGAFRRAPEYSGAPLKRMGMGSLSLTASGNGKEKEKKTSAKPRFSKGKPRPPGQPAENPSRRQSQRKGQLQAEGRQQRQEQGQGEGKPPTTPATTPPRLPTEADPVQVEHGQEPQRPAGSDNYTRAGEDHFQRNRRLRDPAAEQFAAEVYQGLGLVMERTEAAREHGAFASAWNRAQIGKLGDRQLARLWDKSMREAQRIRIKRRRGIVSNPGALFLSVFAKRLTAAVEEAEALADEQVRRMEARQSTASG